VEQGSRRKTNCFLMLFQWHFGTSSEHIIHLSEALPDAKAESCHDISLQCDCKCPPVYYIRIRQQVSKWHRNAKCPRSSAFQSYLRPRSNVSRLHLARRWGNCASKVRLADLSASYPRLQDQPIVCGMCVLLIIFFMHD
jgi:hypothetical protein